MFGIAGTALGIGSAYKLAQGAGWFATAANTCDNSGLEAIALNVFDKRAQDTGQERHKALLRRSFGGGKDEPEFLG